MKKTLVISALVLLIISFVVLQSCDLFGVTKEQRIDMFLDDINQDPIPDSVRYNFSESCEIISGITGFYLQGYFPPDSIPYTIDIDPLNLKANPVTGTISGSDGSFGGSYTIEFTMVKEGSDWNILVLELEGLPDPIVW